MLQVFFAKKNTFWFGVQQDESRHSAPLCCFSCLSWTYACSAHDIRSELLKILDSRSAFVTCDLIAQRLLITDVIIHFKVQGSSVRTFNDLPEWSVSHFVLSFLIFLHLHFFSAGSYDTLGFYSPPWKICTLYLYMYFNMGRCMGAYVLPSIHFWWPHRVIHTASTCFLQAASKLPDLLRHGARTNCVLKNKKITLSIF